jgi:Iron-sulfur cluster-binding domain
MRCVFCALRHQTWAEEKYEYIGMDLWRRYVDAVAVWRPKVRVEIANRGEPTLYPEFLELIAVGRKALPQAQFLVSTNGDLSDDIGLSAFKDFVHEALAAGVNGFLLDCYTPKRLRDFQELFAGEAGLFFGDDPSKAGLNPYPYRGPEWKALIIKDAVPQKPTETGGLFREPKENVILHYHNQGGLAWVDGPAAKIYPNVTPLKEPLKRMCVRAFREMPMWYDGSVPICCDDWAAKHIIGKFPDKSLQELWDAYDPERRHLLKGDRAALEPCNKCNERAGTRWGLEKSWFDEEKKKRSVQRTRTAAASRANE